MRHGTATLLAAFDIATGTLTGRTYSRHRHEEFLRFLKVIAARYPRVEIHLVLDNYRTHKHPVVQAWLAENQRFHLHFTPTSASWMNQVETWFSILHRKAIQRGGGCSGVCERWSPPSSNSSPNGTRPSTRSPG